MGHALAMALLKEGNASACPAGLAVIALIQRALAILLAEVRHRENALTAPVSAMRASLVLFVVLGPNPVVAMEPVWQMVPASAILELMDQLASLQQSVLEDAAMAFAKMAPASAP